MSSAAPHAKVEITIEQLHSGFATTKEMETQCGPLGKCSRRKCSWRILHAQLLYVSGWLMGIKLFPNEPSTRQLFALLELRAGDFYDGGGRTPQEEFSRLEAAVMRSDQG
jgi:hypothetical protein